MSHDYLRYRLTGEVAAELTNISESNFFNSITGEYDKALLKAFGIEEIWDALPPVAETSAASRKNYSRYRWRDRPCTKALQSLVVYLMWFQQPSALVSIHQKTPWLCDGHLGGNLSGISSKSLQEAHSFVYGHYAVDGNTSFMKQAQPQLVTIWMVCWHYLGEDGKLDHAQNQALVDALDPASSSITAVAIPLWLKPRLGSLNPWLLRITVRHHTKSHLIQSDLGRDCSATTFILNVCVSVSESGCAEESWRSLPPAQFGCKCLLEPYRNDGWSLRRRWNRNYLAQPWWKSYGWRWWILAALAECTRKALLTQLLVLSELGKLRKISRRATDTNDWFSCLNNLRKKWMPKSLLKPSKPLLQMA